MTKPKDKDGDQCPMCGAEANDHGPFTGPVLVKYKCGSFFWSYGIPRTIHEECYKRQINNLKTVVDRIPKDAEGNPCLPGDERYHPYEIPRGYVRYVDWMDLDDEDVEFCYQWNRDYVKKHSPSGVPWSYRPLHECYSTKEAAEAEKKKREENNEK